MLVGEGNVDKTALINRMIGKLTCDVKIAAANSNGRWTEHPTRGREYDGSNLILSLVDFGGHFILNSILQQFLTFCGVYVVVFNILDILDENRREEALSKLEFWINTIVMYSHVPETGKIAPIFLVGTHHDSTSNPVDHKCISDAIDGRLRYDIACPIVYENNDLCFFPVGNCSSQQADAFADLTNKIEDAIDDVKEVRPLSWLSALDELVATKKSYLTLGEVASVAKSNGVEEEAVFLFLSFLNKMGMVLWLDETGLRDVVIFDFIAFFVEPVSLILRSDIYKSTDKQDTIQKFCKNNGILIE